MSCEIKSLAKLSDLTYVREILGFSQGKSFHAIFQKCHRFSFVIVFVFHR